MAAHIIRNDGVVGSIPIVGLYFLPEGESAE